MLNSLISTSSRQFNTYKLTSMKHFVQQEKHHVGIWAIAIILAIITGIIILVK